MQLHFCVLGSGSCAHGSLLCQGPIVASFPDALHLISAVAVTFDTSLHHLLWQKQLGLSHNQFACT